MSFLYQILRSGIFELRILTQEEENTPAKIEELINKNIHLLAELNQYKIRIRNDLNFARGEWFRLDELDLQKEQEIKAQIEENQGKLNQIEKVDYLKIALFFEVIKAQSLNYNFKVEKPKRRLSRSC